LVSVIVNWTYILFITYYTGGFTLRRLFKFYGYEDKNSILIETGSSIAAGLALTTVYAGFYSLIGPVGIVSNLILVVACVVIMFIDREYYIDQFNSLRNTRISWSKLAVISVVLIATLFFTTEGQFFSDSGYYHEQAIRWIEEYGTVKGSVHVLKRLAYNSSYFCQCALFSMRSIWG